VLALDAAPGLERFGDARGALLWRVAPPSTSALLRPARARVVDAAGDSVQALPWRAPGSVTARVDPGPAGRLVVLAQRYDAGWHATLDGAALTPVRRDGWGQAFALPPAGGRLEVTREEGRLRLADPGRAAALAFALLVAVPLPRLRGRGTALPPPRASRPLPRPARAPDELVPAPPPQVFDDEHPEDATRPLYVGPLLRRRRRRLRLRLGRRNRKETR
jgi:hypothetical protein